MEYNPLAHFLRGIFEVLTFFYVGKKNVWLLKKILLTQR